MKNSKIIIYLMLITSSFLFTQCTSEYTPIPGPAGADGIDGIDGIAGTDAEATCIACHSNSHRDPINNAYFNISKHGTSFVSFAAGRGGDDPTNRCAQCHSEEGYMDYITVGESEIDGYDSPSPISCTTCHGSHSTFDFENDGHDFALRTFDPVPLVLDPDYNLDFQGTSNNCITCHQPRSSYEIPTGTGDYEITSKRFGPHHGPQSTMLEGIMGANIVGSVGYPGTGSATHRSGSSCVNCHMGASDDAGTGTHTFIPTENSCVACHTNGVPTEVAGLADDMETLRQLLDANNMFDVDGYYVPGVYSVKLSQAAWNYRTILEDNSGGIHNPEYSRALIKNSIEALETTK